MDATGTYDKKIIVYLYPVLLILCGILFFCRIHLSMDILFSDEGNYLLIARNMFEKVDMTFGPLYSLWLKLGGIFLPDPIQLYYVNFALLGILIPLLIYFLLCRLSFSKHASFFTALSFLYAAANVTGWPRVSHFGLVIILSGFLLAARFTYRSQFLLAMALTTLVTSYARTEYVGLSVLFFLASLYYTWKERAQLNKTYTGTFIFLFLAILLIFKTPENNYEETGNYTRSFTAFIQHYYLGMEFQGKHFDYWWLSTKDFYYHGEFKNCGGSVFNFVRWYPTEFLHHVLFDIKMYALQVFSKLVIITNPILTKFSPRNLLISLALLFTALIVFFTKKDIRTHIISLLQRNKFYVFILLVLILPSLAASLIILPRDHYIFLQVPFFILLTGLFAEVIFTRIPQLRWLLLPLVLVCIFFQSPAKFPFIKAGPKAQTHTNVELIKFMRDSLPQNRPYQLFSDNLFITGLLPERFTEPTFMEYSFDFKNFTQFLSAKKINLILLTPKTTSEPYLRKDSVWNKFLEDPATIGFHRVPAGKLDSTFQLFIK